VPPTPQKEAGGAVHRAPTMGEVTSSCQHRLLLKVDQLE
jgi:hypothetical protein